MANRKSLYIQVYIDTVNALKGIKGLKGAINLLGSALRAVFRTAILAGFFILIRQIFVTIQNLKTSVQQLTSQFSKLRFEGMKSAAVMAKGGEAASEVFSEISEYARRASTQVSYMAQEIHKGLFTAAIAGYELEDSINLSTTAMKLATIAGGDFKQTIGGLISISRAFGVETKKMGAIGEVIANAVSRSKMELADFFTSMKYVAPIATTAFGDGAETILDTSAALMTLQDQGLNASKAGVYLRGSMQKLLGSTSRAVTGFAKYGVNIYEATGESQKFFKTLLSGQKALGGHYDKLNELKQEQFKLALAGKEGSREYEKLTNRINKLNTSMNSLKGGLNDVFEQFTLSGGKLKPFHKVLGELTKMPREVVGKMFGIRGGQALQALLGKPQEFERHRATLNKYFAAYKEGEGILQKMFSKVLDTVAVKFQRIKNLGLAVFGALFDPLLEAAKPVLDIIINGLKQVYEWAEKNKNVLKAMFEGMAANLGENLKSFFEELPEKLKKISDIFKGSGEVFSYLFTSKEDRKKSPGKFQAGGKKVGNLFESVNDILSSIFKSFFNLISDSFSDLEEPLMKIFDNVINFLEKKITKLTPIFVKLGVALGRGMLRGILGALPKMLYKIPWVTILRDPLKIPEVVLPPLSKDITPGLSAIPELFNRLVGMIITPEKGLRSSFTGEQEGRKESLEKISTGIQDNLTELDGANTFLYKEIDKFGATITKGWIKTGRSVAENTRKLDETIKKVDNIIISSR